MRHMHLMFAAALAVSSAAIGLDQVALRGDVEPTAQRVSAHIGTEVRVPLGRITVNGHANVRYLCDGTFDGSVTYNRVVRALAAIKHVRLVSSVSGAVDPSTSFDCGTPRDSLIGDFSIRDSVLAGSLRYNGNTTRVAGAVRRDGSAYDIALTAADDTSRHLARISLR